MIKCLVTELLTVCFKDEIKNEVEITENYISVKLPKGLTAIVDVKPVDLSANNTAEDMKFNARITNHVYYNSNGAVNRLSLHNLQDVWYYIKDVITTNIIDVKMRGNVVTNLKDEPDVMITVNVVNV